MHDLFVHIYSVGDKRAYHNDLNPGQKVTVEGESTTARQPVVDFLLNNLKSFCTDLYSEVVC